MSGTVDFNFMRIMVVNERLWNAVLEIELARLRFTEILPRDEYVAIIMHGKH